MVVDFHGYSWLLGWEGLGFIGGYIGVIGLYYRVYIGVI